MLLNKTMKTIGQKAPWDRPTYPGQQAYASQSYGETKITSGMGNNHTMY